MLVLDLNTHAASERNPTFPYTSTHCDKIGLSTCWSSPLTSFQGIVLLLGGTFCHSISCCLLYTCLHRHKEQAVNNKRKNVTVLYYTAQPCCTCASMCTCKHAQTHAHTPSILVDLTLHTHTPSFLVDPTLHTPTPSILVDLTLHTHTHTHSILVDLTEFTKSKPLRLVNSMRSLYL